MPEGDTIITIFITIFIIIIIIIDVVIVLNRQNNDILGPKKNCRQITYLKR